MSTCPFCEIVARRAPATIVQWWEGAMAIIPLNPVVPGHLIVIPNRHVPDALTDPALTGHVMECAVKVATAPCNLITSVGQEATQSVFHLHIHVVPRAADDGLALPWYSGRRSRKGQAQ